MQYDIDASPFFDKFKIPSLNKSEITMNEKIHRQVFKNIIEAKDNGKLRNFGKLSNGLIGTGDQFITDKRFLNLLTTY